MEIKHYFHIHWLNYFNISVIYFSALHHMPVDENFSYSGKTFLPTDKQTLFRGKNLFDVSTYSMRLY